MKLNKYTSRKKFDDVFILVNSAKVFVARFGARHACVDKGLDYIEKNWSVTIQLKDLVKVSEMSRRGFCKAFKKSVGVNPEAFLRSLRLQQAKRLLLEHDLKLSQIANLCGFRSENTFCVAFLREVKTSPKKFQRKYWLAACRERHPKSTPLLSSSPFRPENTSTLPHRLNHPQKISLHEFPIA